MVSGGCLYRKNTFKVFHILASVLFVLYVRPSWSSGKTLAANAGGRGFDPTEGKICFTLLE